MCHRVFLTLLVVVAAYSVAGHDALTPKSRSFLEIASAASAGKLCVLKNQRGVCQDSKTTACDGFYVLHGTCGKGSVKCCLEDFLCRSSKGEPGRCIDVGEPDLSGSICHTTVGTVAGLCPGPNSVKCCVGAPKCDVRTKDAASAFLFFETLEQAHDVLNERELQSKFRAQVVDYSFRNLDDSGASFRSPRTVAFKRGKYPALIQQDTSLDAHVMLPSASLPDFTAYLTSKGIQPKAISKGHFSEEHERLLANQLRFRQQNEKKKKKKEALPPATPPQGAEIVNERIDVRAQKALQRLFKRGGNDASDAIALYNSIKFSYTLRGIYGDDILQSVKIAKQRGTVRFKLVPAGQNGVFINDNVDENAPVMIFKASAGKPPVLDDLLLKLFRDNKQVIAGTTVAGGPSCPSDDQFFNDFQAFACILQFVKSRVATVGGSARTKVLGQSFLGKDILLVELGTKLDQNLPVVFLLGGHHAREWLAVSSILNVFDQLIQNLGSSPSNADLAGLFDKVTFAIIPMINPDGYEFTMPPELRSDPAEQSSQCDRTWRKTRSRRAETGNCVGVDLNRNYDDSWCTIPKKPISPVQDACFDVFCGPSPASEAETQIVQNFIKSTTGLRVFVDFHTFDQKVLFGFSRSPGDLISATSQQAAKDAAIAMSAAAENSFPYQAEQAANGQAPGSGVDFFATAMKNAGNADEFSYAFELRPSRNEKDPKNGIGFLMPTSEIDPTAKEALAGVISLVKSFLATSP